MDADFLAPLVTFAVVYSCGVLQHTCEMWQVIDDVLKMLKADGLLLHCAI